MGGGGIPGPEAGHSGSTDAGVARPVGAGRPGPVAANQGAAQDLTLTGWPRDIRWDEFVELAQRPAGENEDAQINPVTEPAQATTASDNGQWKLAELELEITVNRGNSWVVGSRKSDALKDHEQGHFDIHGIIAGRDLLEALRQLRARSNQRLSSQVTRVMRRHQRMAQSMSNGYDTDTAHGTDATRQTEWEEQIKRAIDNGSPLKPPN